MGTNQDESIPTSGYSFSEGCVIIMIVFTVFSGFWGLYSLQLFTFAIALGLSTIAIALLHLAKVLERHDK